MSVLTRERSPEEFPELAAVCKNLFAGSNSNHISENTPTQLREHPSCNILTMEDVEQPSGATITTLIAAREFASAVTMPETSGTSKAPSPNIPPHPVCFTTEDGGLSIGAKTTSAYAAVLLADLDETLTPVSSNRSKPAASRQHPCTDAPTIYLG